MDQEDLDKLKDKFEERYHGLLNEDFDAWMKRAPETEDQAYARCIEIDRELNATYDKWFEAQGQEKDKLQDYRDKLKVEYDLIEEMFHLEANDRNW